MEALLWIAGIAWVIYASGPKGREARRKRLWRRARREARLNNTSGPGHG